ncbi:hypothetical protein J6590_038798 [Homalodisca vitripennis]|nr:hypothetical protein J6590_038798 [Homalodisca vitripennis]
MVYLRFRSICEDDLKTDSAMYERRRNGPSESINVPSPTPLPSSLYLLCDFAPTETEKAFGIKARRCLHFVGNFGIIDLQS